MNEEQQLLSIKAALDALPMPAGTMFSITPNNLLMQAARKGSVELCKMVWDLIPIMPKGVLDFAAAGGSVGCMQFLLSKQPRISRTSQSNMIHEALHGARPVEMIAYLLEHAWFTLHDWNPAFYNPGEAVPDWAWDLQRRLAARELGHQAAKRALRYAGVNKDLVPLICRMIVKSELEKW